MDFDDRRTENVSIELPNQEIILLEVSASDALQEDVSFKTYGFQSLTKVLAGIANSLVVGMEGVQPDGKPDKTAVKFGLEITLQGGGNLVAVIVQGTSKANLEVTMEWNKNS